MDQGEKKPDVSREYGREAVLEMSQKGITLYLQTLDTYLNSRGHASDAYERRADGVHRLAEDLLKNQLRFGSPESGHSKLQLVSIADDPEDPRSYAFQFVPNAADTPAMREWEAHVAATFRDNNLPYADYPW